MGSAAFNVDRRVGPEQSADVSEWRTSIDNVVQKLVRHFLCQTGPFAWTPLTRIPLTMETADYARSCARHFELLRFFELIRWRYGKTAAEMAEDSFFLEARELADSSDMVNHLKAFLEALRSGTHLADTVFEKSQDVPRSAQAPELPWYYVMAVYMLTQGPESPCLHRRLFMAKEDWALAYLLESTFNHCELTLEPIFSNISTPLTFSTWTWRDKPGAMERHLIRRHHNPLFSKARQQITGTEVYCARATDDLELGEVLKKSSEIKKHLGELKASQDWLGFLYGTRDVLDELMLKAMRLGRAGERAREELEELRELTSTLLIKLFRGMPKHLEAHAQAERLHYSRQSKSFATEWLCQINNPALVIPPDEVVCSLLTESLEDVKTTVKIFKEEPSLHVALSVIEEGAVDLAKGLSEAQSAGMSLPIKLQVIHMAASTLKSG